MLLRRDEPFAQVVVPNHKELDLALTNAKWLVSGVRLGLHLAYNSPIASEDRSHSRALRQNHRPPERQSAPTVSLGSILPE